MEFFLKLLEVEGTSASHTEQHLLNCEVIDPGKNHENLFMSYTSL